MDTKTLYAKNDYIERENKRIMADIESALNMVITHPLQLFFVMLFQPACENLTILIVSIDKASVAGMSEQMPLAVGYILVKRGSDNRCADVTRATAYKDWQRDLTKSVGILKVLQTAKRLILIGPPSSFDI